MIVKLREPKFEALLLLLVLHTLCPGLVLAGAEQRKKRIQSANLMKMEESRQMIRRIQEEEDALLDLKLAKKYKLDAELGVRG